MAALSDGKVVFADTLTSQSTTALHALGTKREEAGKIYRYVKYQGGSGPVAAAAGLAVLHIDGDYEVTSDDTDSHANLVAGAMLAVVADESYGWMQTRGRITLVTTGGDITAGMQIIAGADGVGVKNATDANMNWTTAYARALADDGANSCDAFLIVE